MTKTIRRLVMALVLAAGAGMAVSGPALADDWHHNDRQHDAVRVREWRAHEWRENHRPAYAPAPYAYTYAVPSYAYSYAPPPVAYVQPGASFNLTIPFAIR
jgi:hypothetical protein